MPHTEDTTSTDGLTTSSFLKDIIETSSRKIRPELNEILTSFDKDSSQSASPKPEKSFATANGKSSSEDRTSLSTSKDVSNVFVESSPFYSSKDYSHIRP